MEKYYYSCDGGALALGNETFCTHYMNNYGDGEHRVYIKKRDESFPRMDFGASFDEIYHFEGSIQGTFNIYNYDCLCSHERENHENILATLTGKYGIYSFKHSGDMLLEYWDEDD